ncbi:MAG: hypothetical protein AYK18_17350 [Theionarchaea archaeon DG-70]|nr:MAG: hypothetical protein AYK18_17350 [Theionarchaea archaeon DG-70]
MDIEEMYNVLDSFVLGFTMKGQSKTAEKADSKKERTLSDGTEENSRTNTLAFDIFLFPIQRLAEHLTLLIHLHRELFYCARKAKTDTASEERAKVSGSRNFFFLRIIGT